MKLRLIMLSLIALGGALAAQGQNQPLSLKKRAGLDSLVTRYSSPRTPGVAAAIIRKGRVIYQKYEGLANLEDSTEIGPHTRFNIASNAKQFTALAILKLEYEKKLSLNDDIRQYLPLWEGIPHRITLYHLLTHTSGIRDFYDILSLRGITWWKQDLDNQGVMELLRLQQELNFKPGTGYLYSNSNYVLLTQVIEKITGQSFANYTRVMFSQLGLQETGFGIANGDSAASRARPYFNFSTWTTHPWIWRATGDGNLFSSLADQIRWEEILQGKHRVRFPRAVIRRYGQFLMESNPGRYGFGLEQGIYKNRPIHFHEGATGAFKAMVVRFPEQKLSFITLTNSGRITPNPQTYEMADYYFGETHAPAGFAVRPTEPRPWVQEAEIIGRYTNGDRFYFEFLKDKEDLYLRRYGRNDIRLEREGPHVWHQANDTAFKQEFRKNAAGKWEVTAYYTTHAPYTLTQTDQIPASYPFTQWEGRYENPEWRIALEIHWDPSDQYQVVFRGEDTSAAVLLSPDLLLVNGYALQWVSDSAGKGRIVLQGDRIKALRFDRR